MTYLISCLPDGDRDLPLEIVERKGTGHPDSICDALAEALSRALCRYYLEHFGVILHHNVDKGLLCGGRSRAWFGGGDVVEPIDIFLSGRATDRVGNLVVPVRELALETTHEWLATHMRHLDVEKHVRIHSHIRPGSGDLNALFQRPGESSMPLANDTSCGVGYAPLSSLEQLVLAVERHLNADAVKQRIPALGEDIKVMGVREAKRIELTIACAIVSRHVADMAQYHAVKAMAAEEARAVATQLGIELAAVMVNAGDGEAADSLYLTVTGTSAESGDDGEVGRGNRINGLISFYRPMSMEAAAGKNPVNHVGKLYNILAHRLAHALVADVEGVETAYCYLLGRIGRPIDEPAVVDIRLKLADGCALEEIKSSIREIAANQLGSVRELWRDLVSGAVPLF
jgi:S-adenosylmethionine synthetase